MSISKTTATALAVEQAANAGHAAVVHDPAPPVVMTHQVRVIGILPVPSPA